MLQRAGEKQQRKEEGAGAAAARTAALQHAARKVSASSGTSTPKILPREMR